MIYICRVVFFVLVCLSCLTSITVAQPVVQQVKISRGDVTELYLYSYDPSGALVYERKQVNENGQLTNKMQTEWLSMADTLHLQRQWMWKDGKWNVSHLIRTRSRDGRWFSQERILIDDDGMEQVYLRNELVSTMPDLVVQHEFNRVNNQLVLTRVIQKKMEQDRVVREVQQYFAADTVYATYSTSSSVDSLGRVDSLLIEIHSHDTGKTEKYKTRRFYNSADTLVAIELNRRWNALAEVWENQTRTEYRYYPDGQLAEEQYAYFGEMRWVFTHRYLYEYYPEDGVLRSKGVYRTIYRQWRKMSTISYDNLSEGYPRLVHSTYNFWGGTTGSDATTDIAFYFNGQSMIRKGHSVEIEYRIPNVIVELPNERNRAAVVYPNPSDGLLFMIDQGITLRSWEVFDMQGRLISSLRPDYPVNRIDITSIPVGMYLLRIIDSTNKLHIQKITKY
jgi:hypothetical protein